MDVITFFIVNTVILAVILIMERKRIVDYVLLGGFTMLCALIFENIFSIIGTWSYQLKPLIWHVSLVTIILYFHYVIFVYFIANKIMRKYGS